jgi:radical SAM protein with 4Fe4S-binding SPASM domain
VSLELSLVDVAVPQQDSPQVSFAEPSASCVPHVVAWNLTQRCNLACAHCYISAGAWHSAASELDTADCLRVADEIVAASPSVMLILSGGEPLLRTDLERLAEHATARGATVVVGTNGTLLSGDRITSLKAAGVRGVALSIDSLDAQYHDRFRHGTGALADTMAAVDRLGNQQLDFIVQTTVTRGNRAELARIAEWSAARGAVSFNLYFIVSTGRATGMPGLTPAENESVLEELVELERMYRGRMLVRSKCQPQIMRHVYQSEPQSPLLNYSTRCPCGVQYCRITPEGKVTPCPYTPVVAGDLRLNSFPDIWDSSPVFAALRNGQLGGKCGRCEFREICGGCRARAFATSADLLAADESCAYEPGEQRAVVPRARQVTYGVAPTPKMPWTPGAHARIARVPGFVRGVVTARIEQFARDGGHTVITAELIDEVRKRMPVDFSKRRPFFLRPETTETDRTQHQEEHC